LHCNAVNLAAQIEKLQKTGALINYVMLKERMGKPVYEIEYTDLINDKAL
jgi:hypothetical protein